MRSLTAPGDATILPVGKIVKVSRFAFTNKSGGTGMSNWDYDEKFVGEAEVEITKSWQDYETGERAWSRPITPALVEYMKRNAKPDDQRVFVGQFDLVGAATL